MKCVECGGDVRCPGMFDSGEVCRAMATVRFEWSDRTAFVCREHIPFCIRYIAYDNSYDRLGMGVAVRGDDGPFTLALIDKCRTWLDEHEPGWLDRTLDMGAPSYAALLEYLNQEATR